MKKAFNRGLAVTLLLVSLLAPFPAMAAKGGVVLNFNDVDISTMVKFISDLTGKNFIMDDRVKGKISVFSPAKLSTEDAFNVFTSVLELKGFTIIQAGRVYKIIPTASARQSDMKILTDRDRGPVNDSYIARIITLENISAQEAVSFLQPVVSKDGYISAFGPGNMLLLVDSAFNTNKVLSILQLIDGEQPRQGPELVFLKNAAAETVANVVRDWIGGRGSKAPAAGQQPTAGAGVGVVVVPDTRLNALIIFGNDKDKGDIKQLIAMLDVVPPTTSSKVNVFYLENADATEVAKVLDGVVKGSAAAPAPPGQQNAPQQQSPFEGGKITITPDKATNSLVIMSSPTDYQNLLQVIQKLDRRNRQVFVQAMIAEVSIDRARELGVQWGFFGGATDGTVATAALFDPFGALGAVAPVVQTLSTAGLSTSTFNLTSAANFPAVLKALQQNGALNVLSTPNILTSDNKEAEIFVGENVPFLAGTNITSTGLSQQPVERKDTGITLKIKPMVSEGEYIKLDIYQEISAVKDALNKGAAVDITTTKRSAKTSVVVKNTDTVVIGGLIQDQDQVTISKIPLLGDIPGLGWLFKTKSVRRTKTNLMIMLTPHIVKDARDIAALSELQKNKFSEELKSDRPIDFDKELKIKQ